MAEASQGAQAASAVIWNWQVQEITTSGPSASALRIKGCVQGVAGGVVSAVFWHFELTIMAYIAAGVGSLFLTTALLSPTGVFAMLDRGSIRLGTVLGNSMRWIVMPLIYFAFFLPFRILFRRGRRDALKRFYEPDDQSYWTACDPEGQEPGSRRRQF